MSIAFLAAALLAGTATIALPPNVSPARAEEDHSAHHSQSTEAPTKEGEHSGHSGMGMHGEGMKGGGMMGGGMGCDMMGGHGGHGETTGGHGDMKGGDMRKMMHEMMAKMASRAEQRITELETELVITDAQRPQWTSLVDALRSAAQAMQHMRKEMMPAAATPAGKSGGDTSYPDRGAVATTESPAAQDKGAKSLPERLEAHEKRLAQHLDNLKAIKAALDPLYATFSAEQKKVADGLMVGPMGVM